MHVNNIVVNNKKEIEFQCSIKDKSKSEELNFLRNLSFILEGKDFCSGCAYKQNGDSIYVTTNKFGEEPTKKLDYRC